MAILMESTTTTPFEAAAAGTGMPVPGSVLTTCPEIFAGFGTFEQLLQLFAFGGFFVIGQI